MHKLKYLAISIVLAMSFSLVGLSYVVTARPLAATSPTLGKAASYSVLGGETVTNSGPTRMPGNLGVSPGSALTNFPPGIVGSPGTIHAGDSNAHDAQDANTAAFVYLGGQDCTQTFAGTKDLVGANLVAGVYCADAFALSGTLTLKGSGVWIFKSSADLNTTGDAKVVGGDPCNVWWWEVSSATLDTDTKFIGNILASTSISLLTGARLNGRALAQTGLVSLDSNIITGPMCAEKPKPSHTSTASPNSEQQTATALASLGGLPGLPSIGGGAPIQDEDFPWSLVFVGGLCAMALVLGIEHSAAPIGKGNNVICVRTMMLTRRSSLGCLAAALVVAAVLGGCGNKETGEALGKPPPSLTRIPSVHSTVQPIDQATVQPAIQATVQPSVQPTTQLTPTLFIAGPLFYPGLDLRVGPVDIPLELQIPSINVIAPVLGVGLTSGNAMDAPRGPIGDPVWHTAFWYRGSAIPGDPGTATFAGHVNDPLGQPEIFAHLQKLHPGDLIIVHAKNTTIDIRFVVDQVKIYSMEESSDAALLAKVFGVRPLDGLSHLTLITCAGNIVRGQYDHFTVVYATRSK